MSLTDLITQAEAELARYEEACGAYDNGNIGDYHDRQRAAATELEARLPGAIGARIKPAAYGNTHIRCAGITAISTSGIQQALRNWLNKARKRAA